MNDAIAAAVLVEKSEAEDPRRRSLAMALLGALGGAAFLEACATPEGEPEQIGAVADALTGTNFRWLTAIGTAAAPLDLRNLSTAGLIADQIVGVTGFASHGDGGGGLFYWDSTSTTADDGGTVIRPASNPASGRWKRIYSGPLNVCWFGAMGTGPDDTAAIQRVLNILVAGAGFYNAVNPVVYMPKGVYKISSTLQPPAGAGFWTLRGDGPGQTVISWTGNAQSPPAGQPMLLLRNARSVRVENLRFSGNGSAKPSFAVEFRRVSGYAGAAAIADCKVSHVNVTLEAPHIVGCIGFTCDVGQDQNNEECHISDCWFENYTGSAIAIQHLNSLSHQITRCSFSGTAATSYAIDTVGVNSMVTNVGGCFAAYNCNSGGNKAIFRFGAGSGHVCDLYNWYAEPENKIYEFPFVDPSSPNIINDFGSQYALADVPNQVVLNNRCDVRWFGVNIAAPFGADFVVPAGARFAASNSSLLARSINNGGTFIQRGSQSLVIPVTNTGEFRFDEGNPIIKQFAASATIDLAQTYMLAQDVAVLNFATLTTVTTLLPTKIGQTITLIAYGSNVKIQNGTIHLAGGVDFTMGHLSSITLVRLDAAFANGWFETARKV